MRLVRDVIAEGVAAFQRGEPFSGCPHEPDDPVTVEGTHGAVSIGTVRIGYDWRRFWEIGWNIGELLDASPTNS